MDDTHVDGGSADPEQNNSLAAALKRAKAAGVPKDNIENALKKVRDRYIAVRARCRHGRHVGCWRQGQG